MVDYTKRLTGKNILFERREGPADRRILFLEEEDIERERRTGLPDRRIATDDRVVQIVTEGSEYKGTINLNSAPEKIDRVSDYFIKNKNAFLTLYNTVKMGQTGKVILINIKDIVLVTPLDDIFPSKPELRRDADVVVKLKSGVGQIRGKINLLSDTRKVDRISDFLNSPDRRWLVVYMASFRGKPISAAMINMDHISSVEG